MTTAIENITEYTQAQIAHRKACAYLKGLICGYADKAGHKYHTTKERTPEFDKGFKAASDGWLGADAITEAHILHNRLRHNRPHISREYDDRASCAGARARLKKCLGADLAAELEACHG